MYAYGLCESGVKKMKKLDNSLIALEEKGIMTVAQWTWYLFTSWNREIWIMNAMQEEDQGFELLFPSCLIKLGFPCEYWIWDCWTGTWDCDGSLISFL